MRRVSVVLLSVLFLMGSMLVGGGRTIAAQEATPASGDEGAPPEGVTFEFLGGGGSDTLPSTPVNLFMARVTLAPGASIPSEKDDPSIGLVVVESGAITINIDGPITVLHPVNGEPTAEDFEQMSPSQDFTMEVGDSAVLPANVAGEIRNDGTEDAVLLAAFVEPAGQDNGEATPAT